jgi:monovalent cation:H+ antiporter-2, CPA2 family
MLIDPPMLVKHIIPICAATLVLLFGKPLFVTLGALTTGLPLKIAIQSGMSLSQIGEFSFIIATLGLSLNVTSDFLYPIAVAVSVLTTFTTPYMISFSEPAYKHLEAVLPQKWKNSLTAYSISAHHITEISDWKKVLRSYFVNMIMFSVIIITLIVGSTRYVEPIFLLYGGHKIITTVILLLFYLLFYGHLHFAERSARPMPVSG